MYRISLTILNHEQDQIEEQLFALGASSVSSSGIDSDKISITAITDSPEAITAFFVNRSPEVAVLKEDDWKDKWMEYYRGNFINEEIYAGPDPEAPEARGSRYFIHLDPRDAFGDGRHPTTILCMRELHRIAQTSEKNSLQGMNLLDAGAGSGIIAILAEKLDAENIDAVELDRTAVSRARENLQKNSCKGVTLHHSDIGSFQPNQAYRIIVANLLTDIITKNIDHLKSMLAPGGSLIVSGIGTRWDRQARNLFESKGLQLISASEMESWHCYLLQISP